MSIAIWNRMKGLLARRLRTLDRKRPFVVKAVDERGLTLLLESTGKERVVPRSEIESTFKDLWVRSEISRAEIRERHSKAHPAYVAALLAELPEVGVKLKPIRLYRLQ